MAAGGSRIATTKPIRKSVVGVPSGRAPLREAKKPGSQAMATVSSAARSALRPWPWKRW